jgi:hypothetical protein
MVNACAQAFPTFDPAHPSMSMGINIRGDGVWVLETFRWEGIRWTGEMLAWRAMWMVAGLALGAVAAIPFDRFDPARLRTPRPRGFRRLRRWGRRAEEDVPQSAMTGAATHVHLTPLDQRARATRPLAMVVAEWKLLVRGLRWWYLGPAAIAIMSIFMPLESLRHPVLPLAFLWPVLLWSQLGSRERRHNTGPILFSSPHPLLRQLPSAWLAGIGVGVLVSGPIAIRLAPGPIEMDVAVLAIDEPAWDHVDVEVSPKIVAGSKPDRRTLPLGPVLLAENCLDALVDLLQSGAGAVVVLGEVARQV